MSIVKKIHMMMTVNVIGAGSLGKVIAHLLLKNKSITLAGICNTSQLSASKAIKFIGGGTYCATMATLPPADITFITTPDQHIQKVCEVLSHHPSLKKGSIVLHCSGALTSDELLSVKKRGCYVASVHPMHSFARPALSIMHYQGTHCVIEGDEEATTLMRFLFESIGSITHCMDKEKKVMYHIAGVFASNYLVTLSQQALVCMEDAGVEKTMAMHMITQIMQSTVSNLDHTLSPAQALTGPIKRGDLSTVEKHMTALKSHEQKNLYADLGLATLALTDLDENTQRRLQDILSGE